MSFYGGKKVSFEEAFPKIDSLGLTIEIKQGMTKFDTPDIRIYSLKYPPPPKISCSRTGCDHEFDIERIIRHTVVSGDAKIDRTMMCKGTMGRHDSRSCIGNCKVYGEITLKK